MKITFDQAAYDDLNKVHVEIAKDNPQAADSVVDRILGAIEHLGRFPSMGHAGRLDGTMEWAVVRLPYIVVYEVHDSRSEIVVSGVFHDARQSRRL